MAKLAAVTAVYHHCAGINCINYHHGIDYGYFQQVSVEIHLFIIQVK